MSDLETYKRQLTSAVDRWAEAVGPVSLRLLEIEERLATLASVPVLSPGDLAERHELETERRRLSADVERFGLQLKLESLALAPPTSAPEPEMKRLPEWLRKIVKNKGIDLGHGVTLSPEIKFDLKHLRPNYIGIKIRW